MSNKPVPIDLVPYTDMRRGSKEFLRLWAQEGGPATFFINPVSAGGNPMGFGIVLVDCIRHGANTWARATGISEREALDCIWEGVDAERASPTDSIPEILTTYEDGLIH